MSYLYLELKNAKELIQINSRKKLNLKGKFSGQVKRTYTNKWKQLPKYARGRNEQFEKALDEAVNSSSYVTGKPGAANITPYNFDLNTIPAKCAHLNAKATKIKAAIDGLNSVLNQIENIDDLLGQSIAELCFLDKDLRNAFGIQPPENGVYQLPKTTEHLSKQVQGQLQRMRNDIDKAYQLALAASEGGEVLVKQNESEELSKVLTTISLMVSATRGFLYEAEILKGFLLSGKKTNTAVLSTGQLTKGNMVAELDPNISQDKQKYHALLKQLDNSIKQITVSQPKADIMCGISEHGDFLIFGVSIKSISQSKYKGLKAGSGYKKDSISLGSTYSSVYSIMKKYNASLAAALHGQDPLWYSKQILTGLAESKDKKDSKWYLANNLDDYVDTNSGQYTAMWNIVSDLCATLSLFDALVGTNEMLSSGGVATYIVVNQNVYFAKDILDEIVLKLAAGDGNIGVFGETAVAQGKKSITLNRKHGLTLQKAAFQKANNIKEVSTAAERRSEILNKSMDAAFNSQSLKVHISLGALVQGLKTVNGAVPIA